MSACSQITTHSRKIALRLIHVFSRKKSLFTNILFLGGASIDLERILELWSNHNVSGSSRLILVCDAENSYKWLKPIWRLNGRTGVYVALQTFYRGAAAVSKQQDKEADSDTDHPIGEFTELWTEYNRAWAAGASETLFEASPFRFVTHLLQNQ